MGQTSQVGKVATKIHQHGENTYITYHSTDVVIFDAKSVRLQTGGWETATTKLRMNQASNQFGLGFKVFQKDFYWLIDTPHDGTQKFSDRGDFTFAR